MKPYFYATLYCLFATLTVFANDSAYVKFTFAPPLTADKFTIIIYDGINNFSIDPKSTPDWHGELFSSFGFVQIWSRVNDTLTVGRRVYFNKGNCEVHLAPAPIENQYFVVDEKASKNLASYEAMGGAAYDSFTKEQEDAAFTFVQRHRTEIGRDTPITRHVEALFISLSNRQAAFVRQFPDRYASFFTLSYLSRISFLKPDTLMELYNAMHDAIKNSKAAKYLDSVLSYKVAVNSFGNFPNFSMRDINNNKIESSALKGKYVLVQFWASWCVSCVEEMPTIKWINDTYSGSNLTVISLSLDKDSSAFRKSVAKYSMTWPQVFGDRYLFNLLGITGVPEIYLVDPNGRTIYNRNKMDDFKLALLKDILKKKISQ